MRCLAHVVIGLRAQHRRGHDLAHRDRLEERIDGDRPDLFEHMSREEMVTQVTICHDADQFARRIHDGQVPYPRLVHPRDGLEARVRGADRHHVPAHQLTYLHGHLLQFALRSGNASAMHDLPIFRMLSRYASMGDWGGRATLRPQRSSEAAMSHTITSGMLDTSQPPIVDDRPPKGPASDSPRGTVQDEIVHEAG